MGEKSIKHTEKKKKKKADGSAPLTSVTLKPFVPQPELITKKKKPV